MSSPVIDLTALLCNGMLLLERLYSTEAILQHLDRSCSIARKNNSPLVNDCVSVSLRRPSSRERMTL